MLLSVGDSRNGDDRRFIHIYIHIVYPNHISIEIGKEYWTEGKKVVIFDSFMLSTYLELHVRFQMVLVEAKSRNGFGFQERYRSFASLCSANELIFYFNGLLIFGRNN